MLTKFFNWTRLFVLIGMLASMLNAVPVQAGGIQSNPIHESNSFVAPPRPVLVSPAKGVLVKTLNPFLKWKLNGADRYRVQIAYENTFINMVKDEYITEELLVSGFIYAPTVPPGKRLFWQVQAYSASDDASAWSPVWNFKTPLLRPTLASPINAEPLLVDRPTFVWNTSTNAEQYILQVSARTDFSTLLLNKTVNATKPSTPTEQYSMTTDLPQNKTLYWRVRGKNPLLASPWSVKGSFKTGNPPSVPVLVAPANDALVRDYTPDFNWNNSSKPTGINFKQYDLQVDDDVDFSSPEIEATTNTIDASQFTAISDLTPEATYYWRVRAIGTSTSTGFDHVSSWSTRWKFRTATPAPTSLIVTPNANPLRPTFDWDDSTGTSITGYTIQVSARSDFSTFLVNGTTPNSSYIPGSNLPAGKLLHWRVRVNGAFGPSAWTTVQYTTPAP